MPSMKLTIQAYCKMVLHGVKYPHCAINKLLIALLVDCISLFNDTLALAPMLEVALTLIDLWCKNNSYVIGGYYQANECVKDEKTNILKSK
uniref:Uncharacterized protein n=1 Tax=Vombatus ursinus TaxID=29139 RepID=A0A4X2K9D4_VOMUR